MTVKLSERKQKILQAVIENYVETGLPVSSSDVQKEYMSSISSATIRSELAALEEMGFLIQPHVSSGRMPSALAYKYYVKHCVNDSLSACYCSNIEEAFRGKVHDIEHVMKETAKIISDVTNYTSIVLFEAYDKLTIENIKIIDLENGTGLVIIVTDGGILKDKTINLPDGMTESYLSAAVKVLNNIFDGIKIDQLSKVAYQDEIAESIAGFNEIFNEICVLLNQYKSSQESKIYLEGAENIFKHKEYEDVENVKNFLQIISEKDKLKSVMNSQENIEIDIKIGKDDSDDLENMAVVSAAYKINGIDVGHAGVIGPERMDYKKVVNVLSQIKETLVNIINNKER